MASQLNLRIIFGSNRIMPYHFWETNVIVASLQPD
jgi:hypothetical protein